MKCLLCNTELKLVGSKKDGCIYEFYACGNEDCGEIFILLDDGRLV